MDEERKYYFTEKSTNKTKHSRARVCECEIYYCEKNVHLNYSVNHIMTFQLTGWVSQMTANS